MSNLWQTELKSIITTVSELEQLLQIKLPDVVTNFPLRVPRNFALKIDPNNPSDPILKQILPIGLENEQVPGYIADPLQESQYNPIPGLLHKYKSRVLLTITSHCAINCRYCFRREFPYEDNNPGKKDLSKNLSYIKNNKNINEVILSGGDPLIVKDDYLAWLIKEVEQIEHITTVRIHTRLPIVIPNRITDGFVKTFTNSRLKPVMVLHCNHSQELDNDIAVAAKKLTKAGVTLLNQSVLLAGVNDCAKTLVKLSHDLFKIDILPYYLHCLDPVKGSAHFEVSLDSAKQVHNAVLKELPGYLVPKLVREVPGMLHKCLQ